MGRCRWCWPMLTVWLLACGSSGNSGPADLMGSDATLDLSGGDDVGTSELSEDSQVLCVPGVGEPETTLSDYEVRAGAYVDVFCAFQGCADWGQDGLYFVVAGEAGVDYRVEAYSVVFEVPGSFELACGWHGEDGDVLDSSPVTVVVSGGEPSVVETSLSETQVVAGTRVTVTCSAQDEFDNVLTGPFSIEVEPMDGVVFGGASITPLVPGHLKVACQLGGLYTDPTPASLTVLAGVPARVKTHLASNVIGAGSSTTLSCEAEDAYGNPIPGDAFPMVVALSSALHLQGLSVTGTVAGLHEVKCVPAGLDWSLFQLFPASLEILPGDPTLIVVARIPEKPVYKVMETLLMKVSVMDAYGNLIPDAPLEAVTYEPGTGVVQPSPWMFRFLEENAYLFHIALAAPWELGTDVEVVVDGTGPLLAVDRPARGETVQAQQALVNVEGSVSDAVTGLSGFHINNESVTASEDGTFSVSLPGAHGVNLLVASAEDGAGGETTTVRSYALAQKYWPASDSEEAWMPLALQMFLSAQFVDDGVHDKQHPNDLATLMEMLLAGLDFGTLIPNPIYDANSYKVYLKNVTLDSPVVWLRAETAVLRLSATFENLRGKVDAIGSCNVLGVDLCPDASGTLTVDKVFLDALIGLSVGSDHQVVAEVKELSLSLDQIELDLDGLGSLLNPIVAAIVNSFEGDAEDMLTQELQGLLPGMLQEIFGQLALDQSVTVPGLVTGAPESILRLQTRHDLLTVSPDGITLKMDARVRSQRKVSHEPLGSLARGDCFGEDQGAFVINIHSLVAVGLHDDLLNNLLYAIWNTGGLNLTLGAEQLGGLEEELSGYGVQDPEFRLDFYLSPALSGCGSSDGLRFGVGDLYVEADLVLLGVPVTLSLFATALGSVHVELTQDGTGPSLGVAIDSIDILDYEFVSVTPGYESLLPLFDELLSGGLLEDALAGIAGQGIGGLALPEIDLSGLLPGIPQGTKLKIVPEALRRDVGFTELSGDIQMQ